MRHCTKLSLRLEHCEMYLTQIRSYCFTEPKPFFFNMESVLFAYLFWTNGDYNKKNSRAKMVLFEEINLSY